MRIGFDAKRLYSNFTGLGNYSRTLVKNLGTLYPNNDYYLYTTKLKRTPETNYFIDNSNYNTHLSKALFKSFWRSYSIVDQLRKDNIELYHGLSHELPVNIHKSKIKSIVTIHDLIFKIYPKTYSFIDRKIYDLKFKYSCVHSDRIIAISNNTKNDIVNFYGISPDKIDVVYQSCNHLYNTLQDSNESKLVLRQFNIPNEYLLFVGNVEERKNLKVIIESYDHLPFGKKIPLVIVGKGGKYKKAIMELIVSKGMEKLVLWIENLIDNNYLQAIYQNAAALIYPSLYEGFGLPVVEALLSKTPVITSNVSSLPEAGGPYSIYINPSRADELADAIIKVLDNSELRENMKNRGFLYATEKFSSRVVSKQMITSYERTVHGKNV